MLKIIVNRILKYEKMTNKNNNQISLTLASIIVHFFSDKETNQRNHPLTHFLLWQR